MFVHPFHPLKLVANGESAEADRNNFPLERITSHQLKLVAVRESAEADEAARCDRRPAAAHDCALKVLARICIAPLRH